MITRGYYIGEIIDDLSVLAGQVKMRNILGYTDLSVFTENFFRDVLNILLDTELVNLNSERSNAPGLDLGDESKKLAVQVTSTADTPKVNQTLAAITQIDAQKYLKVIVLGMNKRQGSYSLDPALCTQYSFTETNIWDMDTLARKAISLEVNQLKRLYELIRSDSARLKIELEIPDEHGQHPTTIYPQWDERIKPKIGDGKGFAQYMCDKHSYNLTQEEKDQLANSLKELGKLLSELPRMSREFLAMLFERRETKKSNRYGERYSHILYGKAKREYRGDDFRGELEILRHSGLIDISDENLVGFGPAEIGLYIPGPSNELKVSFVEFVEQNRLSFRTVIGASDLSAF